MKRWPLLCVLGFLSSCSCSHENKVDEKNIPQFKFDSSHLVQDSIATLKNIKLEEAFFIQPNFKPEIKIPPKLETFTFVYPATTKQIDWYFIGHMPNGSGRLNVYCSDSTHYTVILNTTAAVTAVSSLLQSGYTRYDTVSTEIYAYKAALRGF